MKRREYILLSAALLIAFTSCDKSNPELVNESDRIDFVATPFHESFIQATQARGSETRNDNIQNFGVYAYYTVDDFIPESSTPNFMCNTQVEKVNGQWTYNPLMFWPNSGKLSFFAYSPHANQGDSHTSLSSTPSTTGYPQLTYTVPDDVISQQDLLVSIPLLNQTKTAMNADGKLPLRFKHTLACLTFKAKMTDACNFPVKVTAITLGNFKNKASLSYTYNPDGQETTYTWIPSEDAKNKSYSLSIGNSLLINTDLKAITSQYTSITSTNSYLMLLPQAIDEEDYIEITVLYDQAESPETRKTIVPLKNLIKSLDSGKRYSINILVSALSEITLTYEVAAWTETPVDIPSFN